MKRILFPTPMLALLFLAVWFTACQKDTLPEVAPTADIEVADLGTPGNDLQVNDRGNGNSKVFPPSARPYGSSYTDWTKIWIQQFYSSSCSNLPWVNPGYELFYESGPVYMVAGIAANGGSANITIPHGKAALIPLVNFWWDLCPGELPEGMTPEEYLIPPIDGVLDMVDQPSLSVTVDGNSVSNLSAYRFRTGVFDFTGNSELASCFDPCVTGAPQPIVIGGYWIILKPLPVGEHTVHYTSAVPFYGLSQDATFNITVQ